MDEYKYVIHDIKNNKTYLCKTVREVSKLTSVAEANVSDYCTRKTVLKERFIFLKYSYLKNDKGHYRKDIIKSNIPNHYINTKIAKIKEDFAVQLLENIKELYPNEFGSKPIYVFNHNLDILDVKYTYQEVADYLNIPLGTVKSRWHRAKSKDDIRKFRLCSYEVYKKLFN